MIDYNRDFWEFIVENAMKKNVATPEEIKLYEQINIALELDKNEDYHIELSGIGNDIFFNITTQYPDGLPDNVGTMFFNIDRTFNVNVLETNVCADVGQRMFEVHVKKS